MVGSPLRCLENEKIREFIASRPELETPYVVLDTEEVANRFQCFQKALPFAGCYYSVKANSSLQVLSTLRDCGSFFDAASIQEVNKCIGIGVAASSIHYGNTIKKQREIKQAYTLGVRSFSFDSMMELEKIAAVAPGSRVLARLATDGKGAAWPLSVKFGRSKERVYQLLVKAKALGLEPGGICFHVGSQQCMASAWDKAIGECAQIVQRLAAEGIHLSVLNIGGGFPWLYSGDAPSIDVLGKAIEQSINSHGLRDMVIMTEPGRYVVANAGVLVSEVILVVKNKEHDVPRWTYLDAGMYNGLCESGAVNLPIVTDKDDSPKVPSILAGPTCDSTDVIGKQKPFDLPEDLSCGDRVVMLDAGAYTVSYSTVSFNGFSPLAEYFIG